MAATEREASLERRGGACESSSKPPDGAGAGDAAAGGRGGRRGGDVKAKARSAPRPPRPAAAGGGSKPSGLSSMAHFSDVVYSRVDVDKNAHPSPTALSGSGGSLRRADRASGCGPCGDCNCISPQQKTCGKWGQKICSSGPEHPPVGVKSKRGIAVPETAKKIIVWIDQYPKVMLCDVAQKCDASGHTCGYVIPEVLKTKVVHCFKREMRAGVQFRLGCVHGRHKSALARNSKFSPGVQLEKSVRQPRSPAEHQGSSRERTDVLTLSGRFLESWTSESSATCSASFSLGEGTKQRLECRTGMWDRGVEDDPEPRCWQIGAANHTDKRRKLGNSVKAGILPSAPGFERNGCKDPAETDVVDKGKPCRLASNDCPPCFGNVIMGSGSCSSTAKENGVHKKPRGEIENHAETDAAAAVLHEGNEADVDELELFTCQRVRPYFRKIQFMCARTYMPWPFSNNVWTRRVHAGTTGCPAEPPNPSATEKGDSPLNQNQPGSSSDRADGVLPAAPSAHQVSGCNKGRRDEDGEGVLKERNRKIYADASSYTVESAPHFRDAQASLAGLHSYVPPALASPGRGGIKCVTASFCPGNGSKTDSYTSTPSPSALGLSDCETATTLSLMSSPFTRDGLSSLSATPSSLLPPSLPRKRVEGVELADSATAPLTSFEAKCTGNAEAEALFHCEETQRTSWASSSVPLHNTDSFDSCESFFLHHEQESNDGYSPGNTRPFNQEGLLHNVLTEKDFEFLLPLMLSPVTSPQGPLGTRLLPQRPGCLDNEEEDVKEIIKDDMQHFVNGDYENAKDYPENGSDESGVSDTTLRGSSSSPGNDEDNVDQSSKVSEHVPSDPKIESALATEPCSSPSSDEDDDGASSKEGPPRSAREATWPSDTEPGKGEETCPGGPQQSILDEFTAYKQDILLVDVIQDDLELFENLPQEKQFLKRGRAGVPKARPAGVVKMLLPRVDRASLVLKRSLNPVSGDFHGPHITEDKSGRSWKPQCSVRSPSTTQTFSWPVAGKQTRNMGQRDANNNHVNKVLERSQPISSANTLQNRIPQLVAAKTEPLITAPANLMEFRRRKANTKPVSLNPQYCRLYFSESLSCGFKICRFQHVPMDGDEKLCVETVLRFTKNPMCLQKAGAVFVGYYQNNAPGVHFSTSVLLSLLWALLKAGMVSDILSVLHVSLTHKIGPGHEFLLALFNIVRENGHMGVVPELMQLTFKMASAGLVLSLDSLDSVKNTPEFQHIINMSSLVSVPGNYKSSTSAPLPEFLNLAHSIVEVELCTKQEDWMRMGLVFRSICQSSQQPNQVGRISGRIVMALLSESKDKMMLPFSTFAKTVCQSDAVDSLMRRSLGRIGVSLMLRYHKTHQWAKGRRVVEVLSFLKINYSTLKGLFGNEDGGSRCYLVTVATELFLLSGSLEGALTTLRENQWFLSSCSWPCEPADLESRTRVLLRLAEKTSHRDTLEVLFNLPGLKEPSDLVDTSRYGSLFNAHLRVCVDRQVLPVASDAVDFMLYKKLPVDHALLQMLLNRLRKQNLWLRAREVFRHSLSTGYYPDVSSPPGFMALIVPCRLGEVELALALEMFITVNATDIYHLSEPSTSCLSITLKRTQSCESEYLSAGSRVLSAAGIPQPKLSVHYTAVNASQDQVFVLSVPSARCWLHHNQLWAVEVWPH